MLIAISIIATFAYSICGLWAQHTAFIEFPTARFKYRVFIMIIWPIAILGVLLFYFYIIISESELRHLKTWQWKSRFRKD